jgi:hypothetical protein
MPPEEKLDRLPSFEILNYTTQILTTSSLDDVNEKVWQ